MTRRPSVLALAALTLTLTACGSDDEGGDGGDAGSDAGATPVDELAPVTDETDSPPTWLEETGEPRESASGLCTDAFAEGRTELTTTELAACQVESLQQVVGYVQTTDAGDDARTELRVSTADGLAVEADLGVAHMLVVGEQWWASTDGEDWLEPDEASDEPRLSGVEGAATSLQQLHDPSSTAGATQPFDLEVTGSASIDGVEVAVLSGSGEGAGGEQMDVVYHATRDYVVLHSRTEAAVPSGSATTTTVISELDQPQDVVAPDRRH
ncbi:MAG: hypothetical protein ACTHXO_01020 [Actinomycetaceae bacterium]